MALKLVIDHLRGARRGQRQILEDPSRVSFGRHPDNAVAFDAQSDIDASSQHAELVCEQPGASYVLRDIGSSNGTWIAGEKIEEHVLEQHEALEVEFGSGGPLIRLWLGTESPPEPIPALRPRGWRRFLPW